VRTVFDLLGDKEDDATYSLGWALAQSERLGRALLQQAYGTLTPDERVEGVRLQQSVPGAGRTDIEVETHERHLILEAKRGWELPGVAQLTQYARRFETGRAPLLLVVAECSSAYAAARLPPAVDDVGIRYLPWQAVAATAAGIAAQPGTPHAEKRLLREFVRYLKGLITMHDPRSNMVYVVSLGTDDLFGAGISFADIVVRHDRYFHPVGGGRGGWPRTPPNYLGFRFDGRLQQIRHVERVEVLDAPWDLLPELAGRTDWERAPHFSYELGPAIEPPHAVRTGKMWPNGRCWAAIDLLLTSATVAEARDRTTVRLDDAGA